MSNVSDFPLKKSILDDYGKVYKVANEVLPNTTFVVNGYTYTTDDKGRTVSAEGTLKIKDYEGRQSLNESMSRIGKGDEKETDDRGHLIGDQFSGSNKMENLVPQNATINRVAYRNLENQLALCVKEGKEVYIKVEPLYEGKSHRPTEIIVSYTIDGEESIRVFDNP